MANPEHLEILRQGTVTWNAWRRDKPEIKPDLTGADVSGADLSGANLCTADLQGALLLGARLGEANLSHGDLGMADLVDARLWHADLSHANLGEADLSRAQLWHANLTEARLDGAHLSRTDLSWATLTGASLREVHLAATILYESDLNGVDLSGATMSLTLLCGTDLSVARGLTTVIHQGPSTIGINTIYLSRGNIPEVFLRGCGVPDEFITYARSPVGRAIEYHSCFISYSSADDEFAHRLHDDLQEHGVRCWFAADDMKIGDRIRPAIDEAVQQHDRLCLILSVTSIASQWVEQEVETALARERKEDKTVLFPIRIDDTVMEAELGWAAYLRNTRHIGDFTQWKDHDGYKNAFERLLRDLKAHTSQPASGT